MRVAVVSDIHSNLPALTACLTHLGRIEGSATCGCRGSPRVDAIWCLGDIVGYNAEPIECLHLVEQHCTVSLLGNHDYATLTGDVAFFNPSAQAGVRYSRSQLGEKERGFLSSLSPSVSITAPMLDAGSIPRILLCHGSPDDPLWEYVDEVTARTYLARDSLAPMIALGHTHIPFVMGGPEGRVVVNAGSVGQPRDGDPRACFAIIDTKSTKVEHHRVDYDIDSEAHAILAAGLPHTLADRLFVGH
ncbi:MAG: metallophosphoesterase family protein [Thermoplasmatota archaeon]